jgi:hypothetical protein
MYRHRRYRSAGTEDAPKACTYDGQHKRVRSSTITVTVIGPVTVAKPNNNSTP